MHYRSPMKLLLFHPTITRTARSLWTWLWGRYHVPQNVSLVLLQTDAKWPVTKPCTDHSSGGSNINGVDPLGMSRDLCQQRPLQRAEYSNMTRPECTDNEVRPKCHRRARIATAYKTSTDIRLHCLIAHTMTCIAHIWQFQLTIDLQSSAVHVYALDNIPKTLLSADATASASSWVSTGTATGAAAPQG